jgi:hypothetical protein
VSTKAFARLHDLVSELLLHPPHELGEQELVDLHKMVGEGAATIVPDPYSHQVRS